VEVVGFSDVRVGDALTEQLRTRAERWHETAGLSDPRLADLIRAEGIDILVDLALHTAGNRMLVFARKPAPVQVTMLGMPATTGLATMDYRLTDPYVDPPAVSDAAYTEQSIRLPHCYWIYAPPEDSPQVSRLPAQDNGFVTFGCLNQFSKVSRPAWELWVKILQVVPRSRLVLLSEPGSHVEAARAWFRASGIGEERLALVGRMSRRAYLEQYTAIDLSLDPFPYNGHTTNLDSLWMGVPVVTLAGATAVGRGALSILSNVGLSGFIAQTPEEYVAIARHWAANLSLLAALRAELRTRMRASPLTNGPLYAASVEAAFRMMWQRWCQT
jgi:predicted O-linked N-acetylglucosamine transferase (SPINDLY family)